MEEGYTEPPSLEAQLAVRSKFSPFVDLHESAALTRTSILAALVRRFKKHGTLSHGFF
jgi:hypothetical protein